MNIPLMSYVRALTFLLLGFVFSTCGGGGGGGAGSPASDQTPPTVVSTRPIDQEKGIPPFPEIAVTFSEPLDGSTITSQTITVAGAGGNIPGTIHYNGATAIFRPLAGLPYASSYTVTATTGVKDLAGNTLSENHVFTFSTPPLPILKQFGSSENESAHAVVTDAGGNVYVTGTTRGSLPGHVNAGQNDGFIVKFNASGVQEWVRQFGSPQRDIPEAMAIDKNGNIYIAGATTGALGPNPPNAADTMCDTQTVEIDQCKDYFIAKYDSSGVQQWIRQGGTGFIEIGFGAAVDPDGNVYVAGSTGGDLDGNVNALIGNPDPGSLCGRDDIFLVKYNSAGIRQWTRILGTKCNDVAYGLAADRSGHLYITGNTFEGLGGNGGGNGFPDPRLFVAKYDALGVREWLNLFGPGSSVGFALNITADSQGNAYAVGYTNGSLDGNKDAFGQSDVFIVKYDSSGTKAWTRQFGSNTLEGAYGVAVDANDQVYLTGMTDGPLDGHTQPQGTCFHGARGSCFDFFLAKFSSSGAQQWIWESGSAEEDFAYGLTVDHGNVYIVGMAEGALEGNSHLGGGDLFLAKYNLSE
ncbi:MAG: SBBP repeat-containing protein [Candidatus Manganitrophus sp.]|nr:MAG: SBBP repeat-containing protein [Candidatus Manganitrophus sp.]